MEEYYELLGLAPGCSKKELKTAYMNAMAHLETGDLIGEQKLVRAYQEVLADIKQCSIQEKQRGFWKTSKKSRARYTGPRGSNAARNMLQRFGLRDLLTAVAIVVLSWVLYIVLEKITPNIFPGSQYPLLAKTFSGRLVAAVVRLVAYLAVYAFYFYYFLVRKINGMRHLRHGFVYGFFILLIGLSFPQNQFINTYSLLSDVSALKNNNLCVTQSTLFEDAPVQTNNAFGDLYTYRGKTNTTIYIPKQLFEDPNGQVHQAVVTFLPHTHAAGKVEVRSLEHRLINCIGDSFYIDLKGNTSVKSLYLQRSTKKLVIEKKAAGSQKSPVLSVDLNNLSLKNAAGQPLMNTISSENMAAVLLPNHNLLISFTVEDVSGSYSCIAAEVQQSTGTILHSWQLKGESIYKFFSCSGRYYFFTQASVKESFTEKTYALQIYDPKSDDFVYTDKTQYNLSFSPHIASFDNDGIWISKYSNGKDLIGKFAVPKAYMN
ncbi:MAG: J domain-containing protein [Oscillospiraceae bacterium]|jgi:hypothetical protein|nr:J domain-containing protein [Oscillospiraceae bacterium]MDD3262193.1 J domain-containing protein [Oscillospiraceae bacterium]